MKNLKSMGFRVEDGRVLVLDQTLLPREEKWIVCEGPDHMVALIQKLAVRGAPLIGVAAAVALARYAEEGADEASVRAAGARLREARPTAVNLMAAIDRMLPAGQTYSSGSLVRAAEEIFEEDVLLCENMANRGAALIQDGEGVLTHCNSGGLATAGVGTALGVIRRAHELGKKIHVYADETRPLLQGARLTAWELSHLRIPHTLICDNMAGFLMAHGKVQKVFVGADRIAANGDVANKIGTYSLAVLCRHHSVPFYVVAPRTTLDLSCPTGKEIPIEQRRPEEVRGSSAPEKSQVWNPAFDVTPAGLITAIVLDDKIWEPQSAR